MKTSASLKKLKETPIVIEFRTDKDNASYDNMWYRIKPDFVEKKSSILKWLQKISLYNRWRCPKIRYCPIIEKETDPNSRRRDQRWSSIRIYNKQHHILYNNAVVEWKNRFKTLFDIEQYKQEQYELEYKDIDAYFQNLGTDKTL